MRRTTLIRCGVASLIVGSVVAGGIFASGCGGDDNGGTNNPGGDGGGTDGTTTQPPGDDGPVGSDVVTPPKGDSGQQGGGDGGPDATPPPVHGKLILVHGSTMAPPLRFCYGAVSGDAGTVSIIKQVYPAPRTVLGAG